jgi:hypothetical protein
VTSIGFASRPVGRTRRDLFALLDDCFAILSRRLVAWPEVRQVRSSTREKQPGAFVAAFSVYPSRSVAAHQRSNASTDIPDWTVLP